MKNLDKACQKMIAPPLRASVDKTRQTKKSRKRHVYSKSLFLHQNVKFKIRI